MNFHILPSNPTFFTNHSATLLDLILVSNRSKVLNPGQMSAPGISAHDLVYINYAVRTKRNSPKLITYRNLNNMNLNALHGSISCLPLDDIYLISDVDGKVELLNTFFADLIDEHAPLLKKRVKNQPTP